MIAAIVASMAFKHVLDFRTLERIPLTTVLASLGRETQVRGEVLGAGDTMAAPVFFMVLMTIITYNVIVYLKTCCDRAWADIQVSLKKRRDLLPRLSSVLKAFAEHEKELQSRIAELRGLSRESETIDEMNDYLQREKAFLDRLQITVEKYPALRADTAFQKLPKSLIQLENEIAMIRSGLMTRWNTTIPGYNNFQTCCWQELAGLNALVCCYLTREFIKCRISADSFSGASFCHGLQYFESSFISRLIL